MKQKTVRNALAGAALSLALPAAAEPVARSLPAAGSVIARKSGEEVRFFDVSSWRYVDLAQDLLSGDVLRTNATGQLAVLFSDRTQVRLGRNTALLVKQMGNQGDTGLELQSGTIWARAERGGRNLIVDTPAAAAAIRGTDWTLTVGADGKTSLIVLEGVVELKNDFGSVEVSQGEGAVAAIGKAPSKIIIAQPKDREQMLFNLSLRSAFDWMPATPLRMPDMRRERQRIEADAEADRSAEDWLSLSEIYLTLDGKEKARATLARGTALGLDGKQRARALLMEALIAGSENRYDDAARLFKQAIPDLDDKRRAVAAYGGYFARSLADPNRVEEPPKSTRGYGALGEAFVAGFRQDLHAALETIRAAEQNDPNDPTLPAARAQIALLLGDEKELVDGFTRSLTIDPEDPSGLEARARYKFYIANNYDAALEDLNRALKTAPGNSSLWNSIGLVYSSRDANREAERSFKKTIELDPFDPVGHANLALLYLDEMRMAEAKAEIDKAMEVDPSFDVALVARGRYHMQTGEMDKAVDDLLAGSTANPGYSQAQLLLAAAHYEKGDRIPAAQALDNADRLDPADPVVPVVRAALAIDEYDADAAIRNAQEVLRRTRARGGDYAPLGANQQGGSTLNDAFRLQGLDAWGQYYGDVVFDPFTGSSYIDQAVRGSVDPFVSEYSYDGQIVENSVNDTSFSSFLQGLMIEPHMLVGRERTTNLVQRPFFESSLGAGIISNDSDFGYVGEAQLRSFSNYAFPVSVYGTLQWETSPQGRNLDGIDGSFLAEAELLGGNGYFTATPTPDDRIVFYTNYARNDVALDAKATVDLPIFPFPLEVARDLNVSAETLNVGAGWSHTLGYRNVVNAGLFYSSNRTNIHDEGSIFGAPISIDLTDGRKTSAIAAVSHIYGEKNLIFRYGAEGGRLGLKSHSTTDDFFTGLSTDTSTDDTSLLGRAYASVSAEITPSFKAEAALFGTYLENGDDTVTRVDPRVGLAWSPFEGHWLRGAYLREGAASDTPTLAPIGILGLQSNQLNLAMDGKVDTFTLRWDAEWTDRFFTSIDFQHQDFSALATVLPYTVDTIAIDSGQIDRGSLTANLALGHGFGLSATIAANESSGHGTIVGSAFEDSLPFVPDLAGRVAVTWVNTNNVRATLAANFTGDRLDSSGTALEDYWTLDANLKWESFDKRMEVELAGFNLLDEDFSVANGIPGWGPTIKGTVKVRF